MKHTLSIENLNNMPSLKIRHSSTLFKSLVWFTLLFYTFACFMSFYKKAVYAELLINYIWLPAFAVIIYCLWTGTFFKRKLYIASIIFILWLLCSFFKEIAPLEDPTNQTFFISRSIICGIALTFSYIMNDASNRRHLNCFLYIIITVTALLLWFSYIGILTNENLTFFDVRFVFGATYTYTDRMMLQFFNLYYYKTGYLALICFFVTLYLTVSNCTRKSCIYYIFLMITFIVAVIITYSRTAVFTLLIGLLIALFIVLQQFRLTAYAKCTIMLVCTGSGIILAAIGLNFTYRFFNSIRDIWYGIGTLSSRTDIWISIIDAAKNNPDMLLYGLPIRESMTIMNSYINLADKVSNMHSGYLQTLVLVGIPGLLAILAFCIYLINAIRKVIILDIAANRELITRKFMIILPICMLIMNIFESLIFFNPVQTDLFNLIFALFAGYIIEYAYH